MLAMSTAALPLAACAGLATFTGRDEVRSEPVALLAAKALTCASDASGEAAVPAVIDNAVVLIRDGRIERIGRRAEIEIPAGYAIRDCGERWLMPGMIDLHSHVGGTGDINDMVYQANPGLRVMTAVQPNNERFQVALAAGVTTVLFIPGSGTAVGGQGVLLKTAPESFEAALVRRPGSLKTAQGNNPMAHLEGCGPALYNWHIRDTFRRGRAYARAWLEAEAAGLEPKRDIQFDIFRALFAGEAQVSAHTQQHHVVQETLRLQVVEFGVPTFLDHGSMNAFLGAERVEELGVPAILGPRSASFQSKGRGFDHDGRMVGIAAEYQQRGHTRIGFNTDAPVIPQETLQLQAGMAVRYGLDDSRLATVRGLTIVPAETAGIADRVGSLEPGKHADVLVLSGHPADPRTSVERVYVEGRVAYDAEEMRLW
jgi:imidazolonepropionase-like amidohydrolase